VHRPALALGDRRAASIEAEETDWGMLRLGKRKGGKVRVSLHYVPNVTRVVVPPLAGFDGIGGCRRSSSTSRRSTTKTICGSSQPGEGRRQGGGRFSSRRRPPTSRLRTRRRS